jgi:hypothetical protein
MTQFAKRQLQNKRGGNGDVVLSICSDDNPAANCPGMTRKGPGGQFNDFTDRSSKGDPIPTEIGILRSGCIIKTIEKDIDNHWINLNTGFVL